MRDLWLVPFLAELVLMVAAMWLSFGLLQVTLGNTGGLKWILALLLVLAGVYAALAAYTRVHELFLPRKVVLFGVGPLLLLSIVYVLVFAGVAFSSGGLERLTKASLTLAPVFCFLLRCLMVFSEARFTPSNESLSWRRHHRGKLIGRMRRKLRFWLS